MLERLHALLLWLLSVSLGEILRLNWLHQRNADRGCLVNNRLWLESCRVEIFVLLVGECHSSSLMLTYLVSLLLDLLIGSSCSVDLVTA